jgi:RNA polymerase-binding transcription factor DksA
MTNETTLSDETGNDDARLTKLREELVHAEAQLAEISQDYEEALADSGVIQEDRDSLRQVLEAARSRVAHATAAIERAEAGTVVTACSRCGNPIPAERLEALPDTDTCVSCS